MESSKEALIKVLPVTICANQSVGSSAHSVHTSCDFSRCLVYECRISSVSLLLTIALMLAVSSAYVALIVALINKEVIHIH